MPPSPRREHTRLLILDAAAAVFAEKGVDGASIDDIAARAEVARGTVYYNFASKEEIVLGIAARAFASLDAALRPRLAAGEDAESLLLDLFQGSCRWFMDNAHLAQTVLTAPLREKLPDGGMPADRPSFRALTRDILAHGQERGEIRADIDIMTLAQIAAGTFCQAVLVGLHNRQTGLDAWLACLLKVLLDGMRRAGG